MSSNRVCVWVGEGSMGDEICFFEFFGVQIVTKWGGGGGGIYRSMGNGICFFRFFGVQTVKKQLDDVTLTRHGEPITTSHVTFRPL
jgi:hypothetical protein